MLENRRYERILKFSCFIATDIECYMVYITIIFQIYFFNLKLTTTRIKVKNFNFQITKRAYESKTYKHFFPALSRTLFNLVDIWGRWAFLRDMNNTKTALWKDVQKAL